MYGLIVRMTAAGKRDQMIEGLKMGAGRMPGCISYVIAKDAADQNTIWVTEVWDSLESHDASLNLPEVRDAVQRVRPLVAGFQKIAATSPVWGAEPPG